MSSFLNIVLPMLASLALIFILIDPIIADKHDKLKKICSKTDNKDMCMDLMRSGPDYLENTDYRYINGVAIELAYQKAKDMYKNLKDRADDNDRQNSEGVYDTCYKGYAYAAEDLEETRNYFRDGDYKKIEEQIKFVVQQIRYCKNEIKRTENNEPYLVKTTKEFEILCDVVKYSANSWNKDN